MHTDELILNLLAHPIQVNKLLIELNDFAKSIYSEYGLPIDTNAASMREIMLQWLQKVGNYRFDDWEK
jgi:hypothetical protein